MSKPIESLGFGGHDARVIELEAARDAAVRERDQARAEAERLRQEWVTLHAAETTRDYWMKKCEKAETRTAAVESTWDSLDTYLRVRQQDHNTLGEFGRGVRHALDYFRAALRGDTGKGEQRVAPGPTPEMRERMDQPWGEPYQSPEGERIRFVDNELSYEEETGWILALWEMVLLLDKEITKKKSLSLAMGDDSVRAKSYLNGMIHTRNLIKRMNTLDQSTTKR